MGTTERYEVLLFSYIIHLSIMTPSTAGQSVTFGAQNVVHQYSNIFIPVYISVTIALSVDAETIPFIFMCSPTMQKCIIVHDIFIFICICTNTRNLFPF